MHDLRDDAQVRGHPEMERPPPLLSKDALPLFAVFFLWSFGAGALALGRPLFAFELSGSAVAVGAVLGLSWAPRLTTPLVGALVDRLGRRNLVVAGAVLHGGAAAAQAFTDSYPVFSGLEFVSGLGTAAWLTASTTLLADFTRVTNRGRGVALRHVVSRLGFAVGSVAGGALAQVFDLSAVFVLGALTKVPIVVFVWFLVREARPAPVSPPEATEPSRRRLRLDVSLFITRNFLVLSVITLALDLAATSRGVFQTEFHGDAEVNSLVFGFAFGLFNLLGLLIAILVGGLLDRWGRRPVLLTGLATLAVVMFLAPWPDHLLMVIVILGVVGIGNLMTGIALETHAMDLAPRERRGYFLGTWLAVKTLSQTSAALLIGATVMLVGAPLAVAIVGVVLLGAAAFLVASRTPRP